MQSFRDTLGEVFRAMTANKLRSFLTMFGIAWGVASLLLLVGLGEGFRSGQTRSLKQVGTDVIMLFGGTIPAVANQHQGMLPYKLTLGDEAAIRAEARHLRNVTAIINRGDLKEVSGYSSAGGPVMGVETNFPDIRHVPVVEGRWLDPEDEAQQHFVVVLGKKNNELLFPARRSVGEFITVNGYRFQVVGVAGSISHFFNDWENK